MGQVASIPAAESKLDRPPPAESRFDPPLSTESPIDLPPAEESLIDPPPVAESPIDPPPVSPASEASESLPIPPSITEAPITSQSSPPSLSPTEDPIGEATSESDGEVESIDASTRRLLECPCLDEMRNSPCWTLFAEAFVCFHKSTVDEKGSDCISRFISLRDCVKENPDAFSSDDLDKEESGEEHEQVKEFKILPPSWSVEPKPID